MIETKNITKSYQIGKQEYPVLRGIDLRIQEGDFVSICGPSGSGKTTLLYVLSGLEPYDSGTIFWSGVSMNTMDDKAKSTLRAKDMGFVFQSYNLIPHLDVYENLMLAQVIGEKINKEKMMELLDIVGMKEYIHHFPAQLSGGMQQRIAIARALINDPKVIFADEPIGNLDYHQGMEIMHLFQTLNKTYHKTIVMVTHNEDTIRFGTRVIRLLDGVINDEAMVQ